MNRKRALYRYEFDHMKWMLAAGIGCCIAVLFIFNAMFGQLVDGGGYSYFHGFRNTSFSEYLLDGLGSFTIMAIVAVAVMTVFQFSDYHKRNNREYIVSLPFTQRERFVSKFVVGSSILTVVCAIFGVGVFLLRATYFPIFLKSWLTYPEYRIMYSNDTWLHTLRTILLLWVIMLTVYAISTVIHSLVSRGVVASLISIGVTASPCYLLMMFCMYAESFSHNYSDVISELHRGTFGQICRSLIGWGYCNATSVQIGHDMEIVDEYSYYVTYVDYGSIAAVFLALIVILVCCVILAYVINIRQDGAKFGRLIPIRSARVFISAGMAICFSFPIAMVVAFCLSIDSAAGNLIIQIILAAALFVINQKIFRRVTR